ncbi:hypothetical protein [Dictyobacter formicarum]|uniref:Uncharacterized protein n=1 Tax=Dictyobacter formicarum TaxID=2778368 RepID=A0ABQ3VJP4_9CHLR|nr:hypothetical protein [Dictyobacter formicarum]GHO85593.1 hypothetical protein KSZ_35990 [Dictyobacter formicarum]
MRWENIEWVSSNNERCIVYLANKKQVILGQLIGHLEALAQEIELKSRLLKRLEGREALEDQFEHMASSQAAREQEKKENAVARALLNDPPIVTPDRLSRYVTIVFPLSFAMGTPHIFATGESPSNVQRGVD